MSDICVTVLTAGKPGVKWRWRQRHLLAALKLARLKGQKLIGAGLPMKCINTGQMDGILTFFGFIAGNPGVIDVE